MLCELLRLFVFFIIALGSTGRAPQQKPSIEDNETFATSSRYVMSPNHEFDFRGCGGGVLEPTSEGRPSFCPTSSFHSWPREVGTDGSATNMPGSAPSGGFSPAGIWDTYSMVSVKAPRTGVKCWPLGGVALDGLHGYIDLELPPSTTMPRQPSDAPRPVTIEASTGSSAEDAQPEDFEEIAALSIELHLRVDVANSVTSAPIESTDTPCNETNMTIFDLEVSRGSSSLSNGGEFANLHDSGGNGSEINGSIMRLAYSPCTADENWAPGAWKHVLVVVQAFRSCHDVGSSSKCVKLSNASLISSSNSICFEAKLFLDGREAGAIISKDNFSKSPQSSETSADNSGGLTIDGGAASELALGSIRMSVGAPLSKLQAVDDGNSASSDNIADDSIHGSSFGGDNNDSKYGNVAEGCAFLRGTVGFVRLWRGHALCADDAVTLNAHAVANQKAPEAIDGDSRSGQSEEFNDIKGETAGTADDTSSGDFGAGSTDDPAVAAGEVLVDPALEAIQQAAAMRAAAVAEGTTFFGVPQHDAAAIEAQIEHEEELAKKFWASSQGARGATEEGPRSGLEDVSESKEPWIGVCLTGALRAMAAQSVKNAFVAAMHQLSYDSDLEGSNEGDGIDMDLFAHVSLGAAATNKDQSFEASPLQVAHTLHVLNRSFQPIGQSSTVATSRNISRAEAPSPSSPWQKKSRMRVAAVKFFDDSAHYAPHSQCPLDKQVPRAAFWQLYKVADCFHTMVKPAELAYTAARSRRHQSSRNHAAGPESGGLDSSSNFTAGSTASSTTPSSSLSVPPFRYKWLVRARWDLGYVSPLPPLRKLASTHVHVPYNYWPFSDQFALVPRRLANAYFTAVESYYLCTETWWFPPAVGSADLLLAKHIATHQVPVSLVELHAPIARLRSDPNGWCGHQLTPFMMGGFVVDVATITPGWSQPLQNALRSAAQCLCEHRFRKLDAEFAESAVLTENRTETAEDDSRSDSSGEGSSGTTAEASPDISFRAPTMDWFAPVEEESKDEESSTSQRGEIVSSKFAKTPASEPSVPLSPVQPLSCGNVNPLRSAAAARLNDETFKHSSAPNANSIERSHDDQPSKSKAWVDGLVPSELTCNWPTMPTFQLGHTDFSGEQHIAQLTLAPVHPPETLAVLSALRAVVAAYSSVLDATIAAHANLAVPGDDSGGGESSPSATPMDASCTGDVAAGTLTEANNGIVEDNSLTGHRKCSNAAAGETTEATKALARAIGAYTVAIQRVLSDADYKMFLKPPPL